MLAIIRHVLLCAGQRAPARLAPAPCLLPAASGVPEGWQCNKEAQPIHLQAAGHQHPWLRGLCEEGAGAQTHRHAGEAMPASFLSTEYLPALAPCAPEPVCTTWCRLRPRFHSESMKLHKHVSRLSFCTCSLCTEARGTPIGLISLHKHLSQNRISFCNCTLCPRICLHHLVQSQAWASHSESVKLHKHVSLSRISFCNWILCPRTCLQHLVHSLHCRRHMPTACGWASSFYFWSGEGLVVSTYSSRSRLQSENAPHGL